MGYRSQQRAQDARSPVLEFLPQIGFWLASLVRDRCWVLNNRTVRKIGPRSNVIDAVEQYWPLGAKQDFIIIGIELARREPAARRESAKRIRQPIRYAAGIIIRQHMAVARRDEQIMLATRQRSQRHTVGIDQSAQEVCAHALRATLLASEPQHWVRTRRAKRSQQPSDVQHKLVVALHVEQRLEIVLE